MTHEEIAALLGRLEKFEGSDALGDGDFTCVYDAADAIRQLIAENERLREAMKEIGHSMKQAGVPWNDWRREIKLTSSIVSATLGERP